MKSILKNERGALTIVTIMLLSGLFIIMMGVAGVKLLEAAKKSSKMQEAYNYLIVMEEMGQTINRARTVGRDAVDCYVNPAAPTATVADGTCPAGSLPDTQATLTVTTRCPGHPTIARQNRNQYTLCIPDRDSDGLAEYSDFCVAIDSFNYCLTPTGLGRLDLGVEISAEPRPSPYVEVAGAATQQTPGGVAVPQNNAELWSPTVAWASTNEVFTTDCGAYGLATSNRYWLGCQFCADPRNECWEMRMCRPSTTGVPVACAAGDTARQRLLFYFENNIR